jgi:hypothetical protein
MNKQERGELARVLKELAHAVHGRDPEAVSAARDILRDCADLSQDTNMLANMVLNIALFTDPNEVLGEEMFARMKAAQEEAGISLGMQPKKGVS